MQLRVEDEKYAETTKSEQEPGHVTNRNVKRRAAEKRELAEPWHP